MLVNNGDTYIRMSFVANIVGPHLDGHDPTSPRGRPDPPLPHLPVWEPFLGGGSRSGSRAGSRAGSGHSSLERHGSSLDRHGSMMGRSPPTRHNPRNYTDPRPRLTYDNYDNKRRPPSPHPGLPGRDPGGYYAHINHIPRPQTSKISTPRPGKGQSPSEFQPKQSTFEKPPSKLQVLPKQHEINSNKDGDLSSLYTPHNGTVSQIFHNQLID